MLGFLLLALHGLALASHPPTGQRPPSVSSLHVPRRPNVPVLENIPRVELLRNGSPSKLAARGLTGIETVLYSKSSYNVLMNIGNIPFQVALDTGSSDLWLVSDRCDTSECSKAPAFPLTSYRSPTFSAVNDNNTAFNISFADFTSASGFVARETVVIDSIQTEEQAFGLVTSSNVTLADSVSGVLGLGFTRLSRIAATVPDAPPFLSALVELGRLAYPLFGLSLTRGSTGTLSLGAIDKTIVSNISLVSWHDVVPFASLPGENATETSLYLHWAIHLNNVTVNGTNIPLHATYPDITGKAPLALLDVGNIGIYGPFNDVAAIFNALGTIRQVTEGTWAVPCDISSTITFSFAGTEITLQPSDYLVGPTEGDPNLCLSWPMALPPSPDGLDWHFGTPFFRAVYSIFSFGISGLEPPLIGLYPLHNTTAYTDDPNSLSAAFSSLSATIETTAPGVLLPTASFVTPAYIFNTSATPLPTLAQVLPSQSDVGNTTYTPIFEQNHASPGLAKLVNSSGLPMVTPPSTLATVVVTDALGVVHTTVSTIPIESATVILGKPLGSHSGAAPVYLTATRSGHWLWASCLIFSIWNWFF